jgi:predicted DNA-binding transcriptional regulator YafY
MFLLGNRMNLGQYLKEAGLSQAEFGKSLSPPVSQGQVSQWIRGVTAITLSYSLQIDEITNRKVTPQDCCAMFGLSGANPALNSTPRANA